MLSFSAARGLIQVVLEKELVVLRYVYVLCLNPVIIYQNAKHRGATVLVIGVQSRELPHITNVVF